MQSAPGMVPPPLFLLCAAVAAWQAAQFPAGADGVPGPATMPLLLAAGLGVASVSLLVSGSRRRDGVGRSEPDERPSTAQVPWRQLGALLAAMCGYVAVLPYAGFLSSTAMLLFSCLRIFRHPGGVRAWAFALATAFLLYGVFSVLMGVPLPEGWIG